VSPASQKRSKFRLYSFPMRVCGSEIRDSNAFAIYCWNQLEDRLSTGAYRTMAFSTFIALLQDAPAAPDTSGTQSTIRIVAGVLALVLVAVIILRRKSGKKKDEEEF
jgi:hypothetical protein